MFCSACGSEISLAAEVCPSCGRPVATSGAPGASGSSGVHALARVGGGRGSISSASDVSGSSGSWALPPEMRARAVADSPAASMAAASIHAGDLDTPGFPRDLPGRVALLTALVMGADLLLPWFSVNGDGYAPTRVGAPALGLLLALAMVIVPPLNPRWRHTSLVRMAPFGIGAFLLGLGVAAWAITGPLAPMLIHAIAARMGVIVTPGVVSTPDGAVLLPSPVNIAPALGLYVFQVGACALIVAGYLALAERS